MRQYIWAAATAILTGGLALAAGETVSVHDSQVRYPVRDEITLGYKPVQLVLTGAAVRKSHGLSVYAVASYVQVGTKAKSAEQLVAADAVKVMHVVLERNLDGPTMFAGIRTGIRLNHASDAFAAELGQLERLLRAHDLAKGQHILLTYIPKVGVRCEAVGKADATINSPAFAKAVWEIFLGRNNLGDPVKAGLTSRL
jgi:hypothetical protein